MSDSSNNARRSESGGGSGDRNRNRNRNRNHNRNHNRNRPRDGGSGRSPQSGGRRSGGPRPRKGPKRVPLTWWQKLLKAIGLRKETVRPPRKRGGGNHSGEDKRGPRKAPKSGTRVAKTSSSPRGAPASTPVESNRLYLGNLSYDAAEYELEELFKGVGAVRGIEIVYNRNTHKSKGYGFIEMATIEEAKRAVEVLHDQPFMGRKMIVSGAKSQGESDSDTE
ncbi:MAG: RNA-binding protein [Roseibacillus sp.]|nr:RNA-binding protein [Roseibacillus sp.]